MLFFRDFNGALWELFIGNLLMFIAIVFYIMWWISSKGATSVDDSGVLVFVTLILGVVAIITTVTGINNLSSSEGGFPVRRIVIGAIAVFIITFLVTQTVFNRMMTTELPLIILWTALELSIIAALSNSNRLGTVLVISLAAVTIIATTVGLICYLLHYRLDESLRFRNGLIPLITDLGVVAVICAATALSCDPQS